jgi:hypothetical protein
MSVAAVVVAAGQGVRFGGPKQFALLNHDTVAAHSVLAARSVAQLRVSRRAPNYDGNGEGADVVVVGGDDASGLRARGTRALRRRRRGRRARRRAAHGLAGTLRAVVDAVHRGRRRRHSGPRHLRHGETRRGARWTSPSSPRPCRARTRHRPDTPGFRRDVLERAHANATTRPTTPRSLKPSAAESSSSPAKHDNVKITRRAISPASSIGATMRIGHGLDVHRVSDDPTRRSGSASSRSRTRRDSSATPTPTSRRTRSATPCSGRPTSGTWGATSPTRPAVRGVRRLVDCSKRRSPSSRRPVCAWSRPTSRSSPSVPKLARSCPSMSDELSAVAGALVTVKATTAEGLGALGRVEGIAPVPLSLLVEVS